jgi:hypothetical protein
MFILYETRRPGLLNTVGSAAKGALKIEEDEKMRQ